MIFFQVFNDHMDEMESNVVDEDMNPEEVEMRQMERELLKIRTKAMKLGRVTYQKEYQNIVGLKQK